MEYDLEVVEEYMLHGERRFRIRVRGSRIVVNVAADSLDEALSRAREILDKVDAEKILRQ